MVLPGRYGFVRSVISDEDLEREIAACMEGSDESSINEALTGNDTEFEVGSIVKGTVVQVINDTVAVDINFKSVGFIQINEFSRPEEAVVGAVIEVFLDDMDEDGGELILSKRKADRIRSWERIMDEHHEGDIVIGKAMRKIKGGLLVDIGVPVFLPASQVDIRRTGDIADYIGNDLECKVIKIDRDRRNIVLSRRKLMEEERDRKKTKVLASLVKGEVRKGLVKNITDFGAFVDLGGIDGLLHITDMSWGRVSHPSEIVAIDEEIEVKVLDFDLDRERISLGIKQISANPWEDIQSKYPIGSRVTGQIVNVMPYGAFVKLEEGIEGLVHISEMSWTRQIGHPSEMVAIGDMIEVVVLDINVDKQELSLGMKQIEENPWTKVEEKYPVGTIIQGRVRNMTGYGAFIELEEGIDGLLHISDMSWTKKISHPSAVLKKGDKVEAMVLSVDPNRKRVALGIKQTGEDPWLNEIPSKYKVGDIITGDVTKLTNFGAFIEIEEGLEGLLHISEIADQKVEKPEDVVAVGQAITVMIINLDNKDRKIGLSLRACKGLDGEGDKEGSPEGTEAASEEDTPAVEEVAGEEPAPEEDKQGE
ncbi:MAG: 30S ribosomal protein S1 [Planctomycetes bacterium]|nr:30S ribosomal protein S1 [Planctomycetota bacterium]